MDYTHKIQTQTRSNERGFSLFELLITLGIASILITLGLPAIGAFLVESKLSSYTNDLVLDFNYARNEAIKRNADVTICRANTALDNCAGTTGNWVQGWIVFAESESKRGNGTREGSEKLIRVTNLTPTEAIAMRLFTEQTLNDTFVFQPNGVARGIDGSSPRSEFYICSKGYTDVYKGVQVSTSGRVRAFIPETEGSCQ